MACTATIESIILSPDGSGNGINYSVGVLFNDPISGFTQTRIYSFASNSTIVADKAIIQADLNTIKTAIAAASSLQQYVGTVLT
jgi:hypothetical protein